MNADVVNMPNTSRKVPFIKSITFSLLNSFGCGVTSLLSSFGSNIMKSIPI